jgi:hypothetical protein
MSFGERGATWRNGLLETNAIGEFKHVRLPVNGCLTFVVNSNRNIFLFVDVASPYSIDSTTGGHTMNRRALRMLCVDHKDIQLLTSKAQMIRLLSLNKRVVAYDV